LAGDEIAELSSFSLDFKSVRRRRIMKTCLLIVAALVATCWSARAIADEPQASDSRPKKDWPRELVEVIDELRERGAPPKSADVRYADPDAENPYMEGGFYWRMPADKAAIDTHVKAFELKRIRAGAKETARMFDRYPKGWPKPAVEKVTWYAWPGNRDDTGIHAHFWRIMVHDEKNGVLYFFHWIWDVGI
jgi:hypothetical protein